MTTMSIAPRFCTRLQPTAQPEPYLLGFSDAAGQLIGLGAQAAVAVQAPPQGAFGGTVAAPHAWQPPPAAPALQQCFIRPV